MMSGLYRVLESDVLLQAAMVTLRRAMESRERYRSKYVTERQVHKVIFLLALGIREQEVTARSNFVTR